MILKHPKHKKIQEKVNGGDNTWDQPANPAFAPTKVTQ